MCWREVFFCGSCQSDNIVDFYYEQIFCACVYSRKSLCFYYESEIGYVRENSFTIPDENILHGHLLQRKVSLRVVLLAKILVDRRPEHLT